MVSIDFQFGGLRNYKGFHANEEEIKSRVQVYIFKYRDKYRGRLKLILSDIFVGT